MIKLLNYRSLDLKARSRGKNLIFKGICENAVEDCISLIRADGRDQMPFYFQKEYVKYAINLRTSFTLF